ncbi:TonB-dependent receptor plug domain-containing protein [Salinivirga cyanobacteriivorans]
MKQKLFSKPPKTVYFRKWSHRGYGVFQSQGKQIAIATMVMATSLTFETKTATAQVDSAINEQIYELDEVIVSGEQEPVAFSKIARIVTVINQKEIEAAPVSDLNELLEYAVSLDIKQRGQHGVQADIAMRGGTFDQTLVLLNGVNITDPQTGHHNLNLPLSLNSIDRIEILEGPASRMFGVNAYNGAINFITNTKPGNTIKTEAKAGQYNFLEQNTSVNYKAGKTTHFFTAGHKKSDGYLPNEALNNTDFNTTNLFYHGKWKHNAHELALQTGYNTKAFGANSFYTPAYPDQFEATKTFFSSVRYSLKKKNIQLKPVIYYRKHHDRFELFRDTAPDWYNSHNYHMTDVAGGQLPVLFQTRYGNIAANLNIRYAHIYSNVLGKPMAGTKAVPGENATFNHQDERIHTGGHFTYTLDLEKLHFAAGLMTSYYNILDRIRTYPGLEVSYELFRHFRVFSSYNEALRLPTFTDLYYSGPVNIGNPDLRPEESKTLEAGARYVNTVFSFQSAIYYRKGNNTIEWVKPVDAAEEAPWQTQNLTNTATRGVDFALKVHLNKLWEASPVSLINLSYAYTDINASGENVETKYVADNLKHKFTIRLKHKLYKNFRASWGIRYQDRNGSYNAYENGNYNTDLPFKPFWLVNLKISYKYNKWEFYSSISNLLDKNYYDIANIPQPGRWLIMGANFSINYK